MKRLALSIVALFAIASPAFASPINCAVSSCTSTLLSGVYTLFNDGLVNWMDLTNPGTIAVDTTVTGQSWSRGNASLATGVLKVYDQSYAAEFQAFGQLTTSDVFSLIGPAGSVPITAIFRADGDAALVDLFNGGLGPGGSATVEMTSPVGYSLDGFSRGLGQVPYNDIIRSDSNATPYLQVNHTFMAAPGTPFTIWLRMTGVARNQSVVDMFNTGVLDFTLPNGYSLTSLGGYDPSLRNPQPTPGPEVVPEPATLTLVGLGALLMTRRLRRRTVR
jgi:hypothetical protein